MIEKTTLEEIRSRWAEVYPAAPDSRKGKPSIICPLCGNGSGQTGDGVHENPHSGNPHTLHCFKCSFSGDVIAMRQAEKGLTFQEAVKDLANLLNIDVDHQSATERPRTAQTATANKVPAGKERPAQHPAAATQNTINFSSYYKTCAERLATSAEAVEYLAGRGISLETAQRLFIGYDPAADPANNPGGTGNSMYPAKRIILPASTSFYMGRAIDPNTKIQKANPTNQTACIFNARALETQDAQEVFVTEGAFDALSIIEAGGQAVALNGTSQVAAFINRLREKPTDKTLLLSLDNDTAGQNATEKLCSGLDDLNIKHVVVNVSGGYDDPSEALQRDREGFFEAVRGEIRRSLRPDNTADYIDGQFIAEIERFKASGNIKTGFDRLDTLTGGLYAGLYVLAAISSLGKTTFAHQCADQIAAAGHDVLYFSLEQSRLELVSKSLARIIAKRDRAKAVTSLDIRKGFLPPQQLVPAATEYKQTAGPHISIIEGNFGTTAATIEQYTRNHIGRTQCRPIVIVDYLQIIQPEQGARQSTQELITDIVTRLKRMSRDLDIPVFIISSVNRANYATPISFESLKESGSIEFSADCVWGLQLQCLEEPIFESDKNAIAKRKRLEEAKADEPRKIVLKCLKNRFGRSNFSDSFLYYPANELFRENTEPPKRNGVRI